MSVAAKPVLYLISCGSEVARELPTLVSRLLSTWEVCIFATPAGMDFLDPVEMQALTGHTVRSEYQSMTGEDVVPPPAAMLVAPATFNTINKLAHGINDTLALGLLNKAIALHMPVLLCPMPGPGLAQHPVLAKSLKTVQAWGARILAEEWQWVFPPVELVDDRSEPWTAVLTATTELRAAVRV